MKNIKTYNEFVNISENRVNEEFFNSSLKPEELEILKTLVPNQKEQFSTNKKIIAKLMDQFELKTDALQANKDTALKVKKNLQNAPENYPNTVKNFVDVYTKSLTDTKSSKLYSWDPNKKVLVPLLLSKTKSGTGSELGA